MRLLNVMIALLLAFRPGTAQSETIVFPAPNNSGTVSAGFFDISYLREIGVQHLGVDLPAPEGSQVLSPVDGTVVLNRTQGVEAMRAYLVIRSTTTGHEHLLAHIASDLADQSKVTAGDPVGTIVDAGTGPHLHYGINQSGIMLAMDTSTGWGFGQAPAAGTADAALARGWLDPAPMLAAATDGNTPDPVEPTPAWEADALLPAAPSVLNSPWTQDLVAGVEVGFMPCGEARETDDCLRGLGFSEQAIDFSFTLDRDYSGASTGLSYYDIGAVDLALAQQIGADVFTLPVLVNGAIGFHLVEGTIDLHEMFTDEVSRKIIARFPEVQADRMTIISHRLLPDGTQRFTLREQLRDGCRTCSEIGVAVTFLDVVPDGSGNIRRRPATLHIGKLLRELTTAETLRTDPMTLQLLLNFGGYEAGPVDGYPGPATRDALMQYQVENCLTPTGQPDPATAELLVSTNGFSERCPGSALPLGITANSPFVPGIYVRNPAQCVLETIAYESIFEDMRMIGQGTYMKGYEDGCTINRTDIRGAVTLFRGQCSAGNTEVQGQFYLDVLSNEAFAELGENARTVTGVFTRCPKDSRLSRTWFREPVP